MTRQFWTFLTGRAISVLGDGFGNIALGWMVYELTGSKMAMGTIYLVGMVPEILFRIVGAPLIDRLHRTRLMAVLDLIHFAAFAAPLLLWLTGHLTLWHLFALKIVAGTSYALYQPAAAAVLPNLVPEEQVPRATTIMQGLMQGALVMGPVVAGVAVMFMNSATALALNAVTFLVSAVSLLLISSRVGRPAPAPGAARTYWQQAMDGWTFFRHAPALLVLTIMLGISYMSAWMIFSMHVPYVEEHLGAGPSIIGWMQACWPLGFLLGSLLMGYIGDTKHRRSIMLIGMIGTGVALSGLGLVPPGWVALALVCKTLEGFAFALFQNVSTLLFVRLVPDHLRGRVMSARLLLSWGGNPLGAFLGGYLGERIGLPMTFVIAGAVPIVIGLAGWSLQLLRQVDGDVKPVEIAV